MKTRNIFRISTMVIGVVFLTTACTEKIDLNLKSSTPQMVIEGNINDQPGPYYVLVSKSKLYNEDNNFTGIAQATVLISDDAGNRDTLTEVVPGLYRTHTIQGTIGRTYHLQVEAEGTTYESYCLMPPPVDIDSIIISEETNFKGETKLKGDIQIHDPAGVANYYQVVSILDSVPSTGFHVHSDNLWDGKIRNFNIPQDEFETGDTLEVKLYSIASHLYTYFFEFNQNKNNFGQPAAPANPESVFTPDALGYFSAYSVKSKSLIIP